jgi:cyclopropane-fatty-acyl-phospholipid synthase
VQIVRSLGFGNLKPPPPPAEEHLPKWRRALEGMRHNKKRDADAIQHHYDVSNRFYELVLGESMTYTCAVFPTADATLEEAQFEKYDLIARKLDLQPGQRLLDVGCGWGGMVRHAAKHYGVKVLGVTLSREQATWAQDEIKRQGLDHLAEVRFCDYRDVTEGEFDAVSSIGLTEHIGVKQYGDYFGFLEGKLRPGGRLLNHCITRPNNRTTTTGAFIDRYVFPDGELSGVGRITVAAQDAGLEVRHVENLREHYAMTLAGWCDNLVEHWDEALDEVTLGRAKVWGIYMAGSRLAFERNEIELHHVLAVKPDAHGDSSWPLRPTWGS